MKILFLGGTRYIGAYAVRGLLAKGNNVTIATRGIVKDSLGNAVRRAIVERTDLDSLSEAFRGEHYDIVYDSLAYCSFDVQNLLEAVHTKRYIMLSSASVYANLEMNTQESAFNPYTHTLKYCRRDECDFGEGKRQAECAAFQAYCGIKSTAVRFPLVISKDDYTGRLRFYAEHVAKAIPMHVERMDTQIGFVSLDEAGEFLVRLAEIEYEGPLNCASNGTISMGECIRYSEEKTGRKAVISPNGDDAPFNGFPAFSLATGSACGLGFRFTNLHDWIYELLDAYIGNALSA